MTDDLKAKRAQLVHSILKQGQELTEELLRETERLTREKSVLDAENARLRAQLAKDTAVRELLDKIATLEKERQDLLSTVHAAEETTSRYGARFSAIETELESFANLHVASHQLHSTLRLPLVLRHLKELLLQLVGAKSVAFFVADDARTRLVPIAFEGLDRPPPIELNGAAAGVAQVIDRVFLTGVAHFGRDPAACVAMLFDGEPVGVIVAYELLAQKRDLVTVDHELFKLLEAQAAPALVAAQIYEAWLAASAGPKTRMPNIPSLASLATA